MRYQQTIFPRLDDDMAVRENELSCLVAMILQAKIGAACQSRVLSSLLVLRGKGFFPGERGCS